MTIASGEAVSTSFQLDGRRLAAVITPDVWTDADVSFEVEDNGTWIKVIDSAGALVRCAGISTFASEYHLLPENADNFVANTVRLVSTGTASSGNAVQDAARTLKAVLEVMK